MSAPRSMIRPLAVAAATVLAAGCASTPESPAEGEEASVRVTVDNNRIPRNQASIYLVPDTGARVHLGTVTPGERATFTFEGPIIGGQYALVAEVGTESVTSRSFTLSPTGDVEWDLESNSVFFGGAPDAPLRIL